MSGLPELIRSTIAASLSKPIWGAPTWKSLATATRTICTLNLHLPNRKEPRLNHDAPQTEAGGEQAKAGDSVERARHRGCSVHRSETGSTFQLL